MRIPTVLSPAQLPEQELITASLDGELQRVGGAYCSVDMVINAQHRAAAVAAEVPDNAIAEQHTAAWIYGATFEFVRPLQLCMDARNTLHPVSSRLLTFREVVIVDEELSAFGDLAVTSPMRTALDIARFSAEFTPHDRSIICELSVRGAFSLDDCRSAINGRRNLPNKHVALRRLAEALA